MPEILLHGPLFTGALLTGLLGSGHCLGMCGGIVAALGLSGPQRTGLPFQLLYNLGRISTYMFLGWLVGWLGLAVAWTGGYRDFGSVVLIAADLFVILAGLASALLSGRFNLLALELPVTRPLAAAVRGLQRLPAGLAALPLGLMFGFIPCGFLYAVLVNAALTAEPAAGALVMLGFGLGTTPALLAVGTLSHLLGKTTRDWMLRGAGLLVAGMGAINLWRHLVATGCCG